MAKKKAIKAKEKKVTAPVSSSGLKSRTPTAPATVAARKPNKMKLRKPNRAVSKTSDFANPAMLVFPTDKTGITSKLKQALIKASSRVGTDKATLALVEETLAILTKHMEARFEHNVKTASEKKLKSRAEIAAEAKAEAKQAELDLVQTGEE